MDRNLRAEYELKRNFDNTHIILGKQRDEVDGDTDTDAYGTQRSAQSVFTTLPSWRC